MITKTPSGAKRKSWETCNSINQGRQIKVYHNGILQKIQLIAMCSTETGSENPNNSSLSLLPLYQQ